MNHRRNREIIESERERMLVKSMVVCEASHPEISACAWPIPLADSEQVGAYLVAVNINAPESIWEEINQVYMTIKSYSK